VELVADRVKEHGSSSLVVDPVLVSTSGHSLGDSDVAQALITRSASMLPPLPLPCANVGPACRLDAILEVKQCRNSARAFLQKLSCQQEVHRVCCALCSLFPLATIVTPNLPEASALLGGREIKDLEGMKAAAADLHAMGPQYVLVKGGHLDRGQHSPLQDLGSLH
jgi:hydroxymethylpyrimidine/phosphomethylpyrimidine kinase